MSETNERLRLLMAQRRAAYRACFEGDTDSQRSQGLIVVADLFHICGQGKSSISGKIDPLAVVAQEAKRSVYLHIISHLRANDEDIWRAAQQHAKAFTDAFTIQED